MTSGPRITPFPAVLDGSLAVIGAREFRVVGEHEQYILELKDVPICFELDRPRRENGAIVGHLTITTELAGARTTNGVLSAGQFNCSETKYRYGLAKDLLEMSRCSQIDWRRLLEEFCIRVYAADTTSAVGVQLCDVPEPSVDPEIELIPSVPVPGHHSTIFFADGGSLKSFLLLYGLGRLAQDGLPVALFDWELNSGDHRRRLAKLFPVLPKHLHYVRCTRPLVYEAEKLRRFIRTEGILYAGLDSIGFGTDGPPEGAEQALNYNRALSYLGIGTLLTAHVTKGGDQVEQRPFGSNYWHNSARSTWFSKVAHRSPDGKTVQIGLFNRKNNLGPLLSARGLEVVFDGGQIRIAPVNPADVEELAVTLPLWQRIQHALRAGPMSEADLALELEANLKSIQRTVQRSTRTFAVVPGTDGVRRVTLVTRRRQWDS
jgi:hypothetical protein